MPFLRAVGIEFDCILARRCKKSIEKLVYLSTFPIFALFWPRLHSYHCPTATTPGPIFQVCRACLGLCRRAGSGTCEGAFLWWSRVKQDGMADSLC